MPKILVLGATGYIGRALAQSLRRSGNHVVYGLARTEAKATELARMEVIPVRGSATDSSAYTALIRDAHIDVVVDASGANNEGAQILRDVRRAGEERLATARAQGVPLGGARLGFVYTSGNWVHGATRPGQVVNDLDPVTAAAAPQLVQWRVELEREVLAASDVLDVAVVRPGEVYGWSSWLFDSYFNAMETSAKIDPAAIVTLPAIPETLVSLVHVEDAGAGIHAVVDKLPLLRGTGVWPVFDLVSSIESLSMILTHAARALGVHGTVAFKDPNADPLAQATSTGVRVDSGRAKTLLGWQPRHVGMLSEIELYVTAWKASKSA